VAAIGLAPSNDIERGKWNKGLKALRQSRATPEEITERCARYRQRFGVDIPLHPLVLAKLWTELSQEVNPYGATSSGRFTGNNREIAARASTAARMGTTRNSGAERAAATSGVSLTSRRGASGGGAGGGLPSSGSRSNVDPYAGSGGQTWEERVAAAKNWGADVNDNGNDKGNGNDKNDKGATGAQASQG
jgi:hypothetical protein